MFSQTYIAALVGLLVQVLPLLGITVGSDALTTTMQTIVAIVTGLWIIFRRYSKGDISAFGTRV